MRSMFIPVMLAGTLSTQSAAQKPVDFALYAADASIRALDAASTHALLASPCRCFHEDDPLAPHTGSLPALAAFQAGMSYGAIQGGRRLAAHGHPRLGRLVLALDIAGEGLGRPAQLSSARTRAESRRADALARDCEAQMSALNFQKRFVPKIERGEKTHTIRAMRRRPFRVGERLSLYYGQRTKHCRLLMSRTCTEARELLIDRDGAIWIEGVELTLDEMETLAVRDGFENYAAMRWFWEGRGQIIHWKFEEQAQ